MKKILVLLQGIKYSSPNGQHIDMALQEIEKGNKVVFLSCDRSVGLCIVNRLGNPLYCKWCGCLQKNDMSHYLPKGVEHHWFKEYASKIDRLSLPKFEYSTSRELRALTYKGVDIGFGVMSTYISLTRNLNPEINEKSRGYFDALIEEQLIILRVLEELQNEFHFDMFIFQNGRGAQNKPFLNFCLRENIEFVCSEDFGFRRKNNYINNFHNDIPHSISRWTEKYRECWDSAPEETEEKIKIARSFFENKRTSRPTANKVFTASQQEGLMPEGWRTDVENIVIFNSSEDEYCAVSHEFDDEALFDSQMNGLIKIFEHYKNDSSIHFTLRVHPNLKNIKYKYHTDLYKLKYPNLTVIPGNSPISSYALLDAADKVVVFGSTMGLEAAYWGKPVINLAGVFYRDFNVVYIPKTENELWLLIDTKDLKCLNNDNSLMYGYFYMSNNHPKTKYVDIDIHRGKFLTFNTVCYNYQKIFGSCNLYGFITSIVDRLIKNRIMVRFKELPLEESK